MSKAEKLEEHVVSTEELEDQLVSVVDHMVTSALGKRDNRLLHQMTTSEGIAATLTAFILDRVKTLQKPWQAMSRGEQQEFIYAATISAKKLTTEAVRIIAAEDRRVVTATCKKVEFVDKELRATFVANKASEYRHDLADSQGMDCLIVVADPNRYLEGDYPEPDAPKDGQPDMFEDDRPVFDNTPSSLN